MNESRVFNLELENCINLEPHIGETMALCLKTTSELLDGAKDGLLRDEVSVLEETMFDLSKTSFEIQTFKMKVLQLKKILDNGQADDQKLQETLIALSNGKLVEADEKQVKARVEYQKIVEMINNAFTVEEEPERETVVDEDLAFTAAESVPLDPMTRLEVKDPVKNQRCGHTYDRTTIADYINHKKKAMCPYVGCTNKVPLVAKDLVDNLDVLRLIRQKQT